MAEEFCGVNWWDPTPTIKSRCDGGSGGGGGGVSPVKPSTTTAVANGGGGGYGWLTEASDINPVASSNFQDSKIDRSSLLMSLGLSSQTMDWNQHQPLLTNDPNKAQTGFQSMLQEGMGLTTNFHPINRGFSVEQPQFSQSCSSMESTITCQGLPTNIQGFIGLDQQNHQQNYEQNHFGNAVYDGQQSQLTSCSWAKVPQFLLPLSLKQQQQQQQQIQFSNNWNDNGSTGAQASMGDLRPNFFASLPSHMSVVPLTSNGKPKNNNNLETKAISSTMRKSITDKNSTKRPRNEGASSTLPPFKVKKEKMGDRITTLQQLVSPFGKTDTASVLSEAIEYIKFLHEQVSVLSHPYLKSGAPYQQQQQPEKVKTDPEGPQQDLRSRGLCLVPVSGTFPVTHETATVDFWTPTFGGTFR